MKMVNLRGKGGGVIMELWVNSICDMSGKHNVKFLELKLISISQNQRNRVFLENEGESLWVWVGGSMV